MRFCNVVIVSVILSVIVCGCDNSSSSTAASEKKKVPFITVNNPFNNASFTWSGYDDLDRLQGKVTCSSTGVGTIGWKIYDSSGTIVDDYSRYPIYIHAGESKAIMLVSNRSDLWKADKVVITVNEEE